MSVNTWLQSDWNDTRRKSLDAHYRRLRYDAKGQTLTRAERKRIKQRTLYEMQCLKTEGKA